MTRQIMLLPEGVLGSPVSYIPPQMLQDLLALGRASVEQISRLATSLEQEPGFPTDTRLEEVITQCIGDSALTESIHRVLINIAPDRVETTVRTLRRWRQASPQNETALPVEQLEGIQDRLTRLIGHYAVLARYRKAQRLKTLTGHLVESVEIICDLRPVLDQSRTSVEGLIPLTTLRITYQKDEESNVLEVLLSGGDLEELAQEVERAKVKLRSLQESVTRWLPNGWVEFE